MNTITIRSLSMGVATLALLAGGPAMAQAADGDSDADTGLKRLGAITVTAQKREENIQDVPISITALTGEDLEVRGLTDITDVAQSIPNFDMPSSNNSRNVSVRIRGIGSTGTNPGIESSVGLFLDGLYQPTGAMAFGELGDIQSIEVLRGPQGTLYGRNTPVGALNVTTRKPSFDPEALLRVGAGDYNHSWLNGYLGGSLVDGKVAGRLTAYYRDRGGYEDNTLTGSDINDSSQRGLRGRLLVQPSETVEVNLIAHYSEIDKACCVGEQIDPFGPFGIATQGFLDTQAAAGYPFNNARDDDHIVNADDAPDDHTESSSLSAQVDWDLSNGLTLTSITGYQEWLNDVRIASDSLANPVLDIDQIQENKITSQEFRITSPLGEKFEYLGGLFLYNQKTTFDQFAVAQIGANRVFAVPNPALPCLPPVGCGLNVGDNFTSEFEQETNSVALFGQATVHLSDRWDVSGGLRWSQDEKDVQVNHFNDPTNSFAGNFLIFPPVNPPDQSRKEDSVTWSANTRYHVSDEVMVFATASTGFKSGGFNSRRLPPASALEFDNEDSITYEGGVKSTFSDGRVLLNATIYHTTVENFQEATLASTGSGFIVGNAGEQEVKGIEADFAFMPTDALTLNGSLAYLDAQYTDFPNAQCGLGETPTDFGPTPSPNDDTCSRNGQRPAFAPEWQYTLGAQWLHPISDDLNLRLRADYNWRGDQNLIRVTQDAPGDQDAYGLLDLRAGIQSQTGSWELEVFGRNVTDETYFIQAARQPLGALMSAGGFAGAGGILGWYGAPATYGIQLTLRPGT